MNMMRYKGYAAKIEYSDDDREFVGRVLGIKDIIGFHGDSVAALEKDFHKALDFYLESCKKRGKAPDRPYSGKLNLRLPPETHRMLASQAEVEEKSINDLILDAIDAVASPEHPPKVTTAAPIRLKSNAVRKKRGQAKNRPRE